MPEYRRHRVPGGTYFFTLALSDRRSDLLVREIARLRKAVVRTRLLYPFQIDAWVVLPEHMHAVWTLPDCDAGYSLRWSLIKRWFSAAIPAGESRSESRATKGERGIWQRRFWEHAVRDADDFARHVDYVHFNPVRHGFVARAVDWPHSSFRRAVARGDYPADWARADDDVAGFGEVEG
jgi:putative transposase